MNNARLNDELKKLERRTFLNHSRLQNLTVSRRGMAGLSVQNARVVLMLQGDYFNVSELKLFLVRNTSARKFKFRCNLKTSDYSMFTQTNLSS